jgi:hypothetical protein
MLLSLLVPACSGPSRPFQVLTAPPQTAYRTLGMVSGQGENRESAVHAAIQQAERLDADAIIVVGERPVGRVIIVTARAIQYQGPPPPAPY